MGWFIHSYTETKSGGGGSKGEFSWDQIFWSQGKKLIFSTPGPGSKACNYT